ncbi:MAG: type I methionyl aminopeptidase [Chloroflexi bacterium]|nr:type I methionyl aminopeptidase [Chloroflexota bacterium]
MGIEIKSANEIGLMREAGRIVAETLATLAGALRVGMMTRELDDIAREEIEKRGGIPSFKDYRGYPAYVCVSVNEQVVHGIPGERVLRDGDIVSLDLGAIYRGFQGDAAVTVGLGQVSRQGRELIEATRGALENGIAAAKPGAHLGDISAAIQRHAESKGFSVVREYVGHGIGRQMHEDPQVPNYGNPGEGVLLRKGMTMALEPMVNVGGWRTRALEDGWTVVTADGSLSAHFEHTIVITDGGAEVLTLP